MATVSSACPMHVLLLLLGAAPGAEAQPPSPSYALESHRYRSSNCTGRGVTEQRFYLDRCADYGADLLGATYTV